MTHPYPAVLTSANHSSGAAGTIEPNTIFKQWIVAVMTTVLHNNHKADQQNLRLTFTVTLYNLSLKRGLRIQNRGNYEAKFHYTVHHCLLDGNLVSALIVQQHHVQCPGPSMSAIMSLAYKTKGAAAYMLLVPLTTACGINILTALDCAGKL